MESPMFLTGIIAGISDNMMPHGRETVWRFFVCMTGGTDFIGFEVKETDLNTCFIETECLCLCRKLDTYKWKCYEEGRVRFL